MEKNSFFKTKEGGLTLAFIVIMIAFAIMLFGLYTGTTAMFYSPVKVFILTPKHK